ncbi:hypothetical protein [Cedecea sp. NFIX57]|uniref:hypothetical protein n=1 Tax=Cedecea sp. NFIX57 TaxID=1566286 RepID=UPI000A0DCB7A|nr:hypothetical protein [Cedecea sp. NFIX57]SMG60649.1 hypothetical protein SAMN03159353_103822 [Cedecea sp. NFIX57]
MLDTFSKRLRFCRTVTELTTNEVIEYIKLNGGKISVSGYSYWERTKDGTFPKKSSLEIEILCLLFNQKGLTVTSEWILYGQGQPPTMPWPGVIDDAELFNHCGDMLRHSKKWEVIQVAGSYGEPIILIGETLVVTEVEIYSSIHRKLVLVIESSSIRHAGVANVVDDETIEVINKHTTLLQRSNIMKLYQIKWIRKV